MFGIFRLSDTAKSVLWLWNNDPANWQVGQHAVAHRPTGIAIWTSNEVYGLKVYYDVPERDRDMAHPLRGTPVKLKWLDRKALYSAISLGSDFAGREIQRQASEWATRSLETEVK